MDMTKKYSKNKTHMPTGGTGKSEIKPPRRLMGGNRGGGGAEHHMPGHKGHKGKK